MNALNAGFLALNHEALGKYSFETKKLTFYLIVARKKSE
jgi:hypothetical protein